ncbi:MAG: glycosyltransferase family 2 protein [Lachnospiraceae bacterium]|nr:glycosyltransferase family 2 protein [Lachnospiraceae bacterium]
MSKNIQIIIPACNERDMLERTLRSIREQTYDKDRIHTVVVDFGSTDGTCEWLLSHEGYHVGVYKKAEQVQRGSMIAEIAMLSPYLWPEGYGGFYTVLYPGEVLYSNALEICMREYEEHCEENPVIVLCEADIEERDGSVHRQENMFAQSRMLMAGFDTWEYTCRGYHHQIITLSPFLFAKERRDGAEMNEQRWWNKCSMLCGQHNTLYISARIGRVKRIQYEDEVEELLLRWESVIAQIRGRKLDETFKDQSMDNLARYALWRSFELYEKRGSDRAAEDCFLLSSLISPDIVEQEQYQNIQKLFDRME